MASSYVLTCDFETKFSLVLALSELLTLNVPFLVLISISVVGIVVPIHRFALWRRAPVACASCGPSIVAHVDQNGLLGRRWDRRRLLVRSGHP